jgi:hypothetical protein
MFNSIVGWLLISVKVFPVNNQHKTPGVYGKLLQTRALITLLMWHTSSLCLALLVSSLCASRLDYGRVSSLYHN